MSHKQAKRERHMSGDNHKGAVQPQPIPPIQVQIVINFHGGQMVSVQGPTDPKLFFFMIGQAIASMGQRCEYKEQSPIVKVPVGTRIVS